MYDALLYDYTKQPSGTRAWRQDIFQPPIRIWKPLIGGNLQAAVELGRGNLLLYTSYLLFRR